MTPAHLFLQKTGLQEFADGVARPWKPCDVWKPFLWVVTLPETNSSPQKWWLSIGISFLKGLFSGDMLVSGRIKQIFFKCRKWLFVLRRVDFGQVIVAEGYSQRNCDGMIFMLLFVHYWFPFFRVCAPNPCSLSQAKYIKFQAKKTLQLRNWNLLWTTTSSELILLFFLWARLPCYLNLTEIVGSNSPKRYGCGDPNCWICCLQYWPLNWWSQNSPEILSEIHSIWGICVVSPPVSLMLDGIHDITCMQILDS